MAAQASKLARKVATATLTLDPIVEEAAQRWKRASEWESTARQAFVEDLKIRHGDDTNGYQWPASVRNARNLGNKPCLTMNIIRQHNLQISNQAKKNKSEVKIIGVGGGATADSAKTMQDICRHIEYQSRAQIAYSIGREFQIDGGIGWWRILTDYARGEETFDQEIYIEPVPDPLSIFIDCDCVMRDKSDAKWALVFGTVTLEDFEQAYPDFDGQLTGSPLGIGPVENSLTDSEYEVEVCEYFRVTMTEDWLISYVGEDGVRKELRQSSLPKEVRKPLLADPATRKRKLLRPKVEWILIANEKIVDQTEWPGSFIPLIPVIGEETIIEKKLDRKGHTRAMLSAQRMYNYNASAQVEFVALQGKTPWVVAAKAIEELEPMWNTANTVNHSVLVYNHLDQEGGSEVPIPAPVRTDPPNVAPAYQAGMETAFNQMMMTSGQFQNQMGMQGNERTGEAISQRQEQSDTATFHFEDNYELALQATGRQLIDLIPKVYNTARTKRIIASDGTDYDLLIDPTAKQVLQQKQGQQQQTIARILNPQMGKYDVAAKVGPAGATKREEAVQAISLIITQNPAFGSVIGDLLLENLDFDGAQEAAQRLKRMVPPQALGQPGPASQQEQQLQEALTKSQGLVQKLMAESAKDKIKIAGKDEMRDIESYDSETKRMAALVKMLPMDQDGLQQVIHQLVGDSLQIHLGGVVAANEGTVPGVSAKGAPAGKAPGEAPPLPGAKKAPDGNWYVPDPHRPGKFLRADPIAGPGPATPQIGAPNAQPGA